MIERHPIYFDWEADSSNPRVIELVNAMYDDLNLGKLKVSTKKELLNTILTNLLDSERKKRGIMYSRNNGWYNSIPSKYKYPFQTYDLVIKTIDALLAKGYIKQVKGSWDMLSTHKEQSVIKPSKKLLSYFSYLSKVAIEYRPPAQEVVLRNITIEEILDKKTGKKKKKKKREFINYEETPETIRMRKIVREWNDLRRKSIITLDIPKGVYDPSDENDKLIYYAELKSADKKAYHFVAYPKGAYRTFSYTFEQYGRYSAGIETLVKREYRPFFKINGEVTTELDFQALHTRMLYNIEGIDYQEDPYQVAADSFNEPKYRVRKYFKKIGLMAINAKTDKATIRAVRTELLEEDVPKDIPYKDLEKMLDHWLTVHQPIANYLCSGMGLKLMYKDSCIAENIIQHFTNKSIMVMTVHDSFIIDKKHEYELKSVMERSYQAIMNVKFKSVIDKKF